MQFNPIQIIHISNLLTYISLASGLAGFIYFGQTGRPHVFGFFLAASFICDLFDGKFSALFKNRPLLNQKTGTYLDSLVDFAVFAILPSITISLYLKNNSINLFIPVTISYIFMVSAMSRLAIFHYISEQNNSEEKYFIGMPTTLNGLFISFILLFTESQFIFLFYLLIASYLMLAKMKIKRPQKMGLFILLFSALLIGFTHLFFLIKN